MRSIRVALPTLLLVLSTAAPAFANFDGNFPGVGSRAAWKSASALSNTALDAERKKDFRTAERLFYQAIRVYPFDAAIHVNLGNCLLDDMKPREAERAYRQSIATEPHFTNWLGLTKSLINQNRVVEAKRAIANASKYARTASQKKTVEQYEIGLKELSSSQ